VNTGPRDRRSLQQHWKKELLELSSRRIQRYDPAKSHATDAISARCSSGAGVQAREDMTMAKLFIANIRSDDGFRPLVTVRAAAEGEARLFLAAAYPDDAIVDVVEPSDWTSDADTGSKAGDIREHAGVEWQAPSSLAQ
jgi:hypothetical protein